LKKVLAVFGTRPEAIKVLPVVLELRRSQGDIRCDVLATGQHRELLDEVLTVFDVEPEHNLRIMTDDQSLTDVTVRALEGIDRFLAEHPADLVLVQGDTTTTLAAALAAFYRKIPVGHLEAGLRTRNRYYPYPEEINRTLTTHLTTLHFAPSRGSADNLRAEGVDEAAITLTGNTVIDALRMTVARPHRLGESLEAAMQGRRTILVTAHRRESFGAPLREAMGAIRDLVARYPDTCVIYPVHPNPNARSAAHDTLAGRDRVHLLEPMNYLDFVHVMNRSHMLLTDSGGLQEEAPALGKPVLVLRDETERPEAVAAGTARLVGCHRDAILREGSRLLDDASAYESMARAHNPYGDGTAAAKTVAVIRRHLERPGS
jgi:UDP-N-acetylglucosamine 2-epimerase (non-hydrolysing)